MSSADLLKHDDFGSESEDDVDFNPAPADDSDHNDAADHSGDDRAAQNKRGDDKLRRKDEDEQAKYESDEGKLRGGRNGRTEYDEDEDGEGEPDDIGMANGDNDVEEDAEGDEDDDDEEDDDEEDEDEEVGPRRKRRRDRRNGLRTFIDVEAEVDEDEDELEEEDEDFAREADGFIADTHPDDLADLPAGVETDDRRHRQLDRQREREAGLDAEKQAEVFKQRYGRSNRQATASDAVAVPKRLLLPSVEDPSIWGVRCKPGKEREAVLSIMKRLEERADTKMPLGITCAFERGGTMAGYVYVEARKWPDVLNALDGISNVYPRTKHILVEIKEMPDLLRVTKTKALEPGAYVRIRRGKYAGDVAQVDAVETNGLEVLLRIVPRLDYGLNEDANAPVPEGGAAKRKRPGGQSFNAKARPPQRLFSEAEARKRHAKYVQRVRNGEKTHWTYLGDDYDNGYLMKEFKIQFLQTEDVNPTLEEVTLFASGADDGTENLDLNALAIDLRRSQASGNYVPGDVVEVYEGEQQGVYGKAVSVIGDIVTLTVSDGELKGQTIEVPIKGLRKRFRAGDHVKVIGGSRFRDEVGMVVRIKEDRVTILTDNTMQEITVFSKDLREAADSGNSGNKLSYLELHDLIALDQATVACILKVDREALQIIDQFGDVRTIMPSQISNHLTGRKNAVATDRNGSEIRVGDTVREVTGEHRQGVILHIHRAFAFLHDREQTQNGGVFPVRTTNVTTIAAKGGRAIKSAQSVDLTKMNPALMMNGSSNGSMQPPPRSFGRDRMLGKTVKIRTGQYKGVLGIVKDTTDTEARVELHTKAKIINVPKSILNFVDPITGQPIDPNTGRSAGLSSSRHMGSALPTRTPSNWEGARTPSGASGSRTPAWGTLARTSAWNSGGRTPGWKQDSAGGRTPAYGDGGRTVNPYADGNRTVNPYADGGRTAYGGGNKTPAWNPGSRTTFGAGSNDWSTGSKTPAYGGDPWGSKTPAYTDDNWGTSVKTDTWTSTANAYDAPTPGDISAPTPGAMNAPTPGNYSAPTPAATAPTPRPGVSGWGAGTANAGWGESAPTPAAQSAPTPGASHGGKAGRPGYYDAPTPAGYNNPQTPGNWGAAEENDEPRYSTPSP